MKNIKEKTNFNSTMNHSFRIKKIHVIQSPNWAECLIAETIVYIYPMGFALPPGTRIFCSKCGECIGTTKELIVTPFDNHIFNSAMTDIDYIPTGYSLKHKDHSLFAGQMYQFIAATDYFRSLYVEKSRKEVDRLIESIKPKEHDGN